MNTKQRAFLLSEVVTLNSLLEELPKGRVIERIGLQHRLQQAEERLAELEGQALAKPLAFTFKGTPVEGGRSIDANFRSSALKANTLILQRQNGTGANMIPTLPLNQMSVEEKIRTMENLWDSLLHEGSEIASPDWHGQVLAERETAIERGEAGFEDWETAKERIRKQLR